MDTPPERYEKIIEKFVGRARLIAAVALKRRDAIIVKGRIVIL